MQSGRGNSGQSGRAAGHTEAGRSNEQSGRGNSGQSGRAAGFTEARRSNEQSGRETSTREAEMDEAEFELFDECAGFQVPTTVRLYEA